MAGAVDRAYEEIRAAILDGTVHAGERLLEEDLAERVGVSRTPVREALRRLAADGLVEFVPNRGAHVAAWSDQDLREIFGLRALLEGHAARMAAERIDESDLAKLADLAAQMEQSAAKRNPDLDAIAALNDELHHLVLAAAGNQRLADMVSSLVQVPLVQRTFRHYDRDDLERSLGHHRELLSALQQRDAAWAEAVMRSHILAARNVLMEALPSPPKETP